MPNLATRPVRIWSRGEVFVFGVFQLQPHPRFAVHNLKKLVYYAKSKGKAGYPMLSYSVWKHVACNKLQISEDLAWTFFQTCIIMSEANSAALRVMESAFSKARTPVEFEKLKSVQSVDLFVFVLFLYLQSINKLSLRSSVASISAEWPGSPTKTDDSSSDRSSLIRPYRNSSELYQFQFISDNLMELLGLLCESDAYGANKAQSVLSYDAIIALSFLFEGTTDNTVRSVHEILFQPQNLSQLGYNKPTRTFNLRDVYPWFRSYLVQNPFSMESCILTGSRIQWTLSGNSSVLGNSTDQERVKHQKIATNAGQLPVTTGMQGNKIVVISMISHQIISRASRILKFATVKIHRTDSSYLYLLSPLRSVKLDRCRNTTVVLGPVENTLLISGCEDCLIIAAARRVVLSCSRRCTLHLASPTRPVVLQPVDVGYGNRSSLSPAFGAVSTSNSPISSVGNEEIIFAPYNTSYYSLAHQLEKVNLDPTVNLWDQPFLLGHDFIRHKSTSMTGMACPWDFLQPSDFFIFNIPLIPASSSGQPDSAHLGEKSNSVPITASIAAEIERLHDLTRALVAVPTPGALVADRRLSEKENFKVPDLSCLPITIPNLFADALSKRAIAFNQWQQFVEESNLTKDHHSILSSFIEQSFISWLNETGAIRELQLLETGCTS